MGLKNYIDKLKKKYIEMKVSYAEKPNFQETSIVRKHIIFSGKVQNVGFRYETYQLAKGLDLTGWVMNKPDRTVESEIQGGEEKISFLVKHMKSLKRANVNNVEIKRIDLKKDEEVFEILI